MSDKASFLAACRSLGYSGRIDLGAAYDHGWHDPREAVALARSAGYWGPLFRPRSELSQTMLDSLGYVPGFPRATKV